MNNPFSILNRYLFVEMLPPFFINMAFFSFIFLMKQLLEITDMIVNHNVSFAHVFLLLAYTTPYFFQYVIPMSVMMAVLLALLRMSGDNEVLAIKAGGLSVYRMLPPVLAFSLLGTLITGYITIVGVPLSAERFKKLVLDVATTNLDVSLKERTFNDNFKDVILYVNKIDPNSGSLQNVLIEDRRTPNAHNTVVASTGVLVGEPEKLIYHLRLYNGTINQLDVKKRSSHTIHFKTYDIRLDLKDVMSVVSESHKTPNEMTLTELTEYLNTVRDRKNVYDSALLKYHKKFSLPVACLAMGVLALPLGIVSRRSNKAYGIGLCLFYFLLYYILLTVGTTLGENGSCPPLIAMWVPNITLGGFGVLLLVRSAKEKHLSFDWFWPVVDKTIKWVGKK